MRVYPPPPSESPRSRMADVQLPGAKAPEMTSWSRYDPVYKSGNTDHWTKLKCRSNAFRATHSAGGTVKIVPEHDVDQITSVKNPGERYKVDPNRGVVKLPPVTFNDSVLGRLDKAPGDHDALTRPSGNLRRSWMDNEFQRRARDGFRYWLINRPPPTKFGRYGMGSYKMVMGIGMAPRT